MDVAQEIERQEPVDGDAIEARSVRVVMGHNRTDKDLQEENTGHDQEVFADTALTRGQRPELREHRIHWRLVRIVEIPLVNEQHGAEGKEGEAEADPGPTEGAGGWRIANQRFIRPVLRPGDIRAGAARNSRERRIDQKFRRLIARLSHRGYRPASSPWRSRGGGEIARFRRAAS